MKLVDILARELKVWPKNVHAITQDDNGLLNGSSAEDPPIAKSNAWGGGAFYLDDPVKPENCFVLELADDYRAAIITRAKWQAAVDALKAESAPAWVGVGLPPAGTVCEIKGCMSHYLQWNKVTVFAVRGDTVFFDMEDGRWGQTNSHEIRQLRTPEQIAAEEREREVELAIQTLNLSQFCPESIAVQNGIRHAVGEMITAGYRKFEIVDKDDGDGV